MENSYDTVDNSDDTTRCLVTYKQNTCLRLQTSGFRRHRLRGNGARLTDVILGNKPQHHIKTKHDVK
jgi:hypothetical protein